MVFPSIGIVIPTFQAAQHLPYCLPPLLHSPLKPRILIIDSSSTDHTVELAQKMGVQDILIIPRCEFNHGLTREKGRRYLQTDIVVMMTQDAYATSEYMLDHLIKPLIEKRASISYARQLPHTGASILATFARQFNYPSQSHVRCLADIPIYGSYTFFCSNSCAAYLNTALDEIGGFPSVQFGEDSWITTKLLHRHHHIAYVAEAEVYHSHDYTLRQEFSRHFEMGFARHTYRHLLTVGGTDSQRGRQFVQALFRTLWKSSPSSIPYASLHILAKWLGYRMGQIGCYLSHQFKIFLIKFFKATPCQEIELNIRCSKDLSREIDL